MFDEDHDLTRAGQLLRETFPWVLTGAHVFSLTPGGRRVALGFVGDDEVPVRTITGFRDVARHYGDPAYVTVLVDDGEVPAEELAAVAWSLQCLDTTELAVVAPVASRYLESALPPGTYLQVERRYVPVRAVDPWPLPAPTPAPPPPRRVRPERSGKPWDADEEARLEALIREGTALADIAKALGRTRGGVTARIAQMAIRQGTRPAVPSG